MYFIYHFHIIRAIYIGGYLCRSFGPTLCFGSRFSLEQVDQGLVHSHFTLSEADESLASISGQPVPILGQSCGKTK